jgi:hypothetical protein
MAGNPSANLPSYIHPLADTLSHLLCGDTSSSSVVSDYASVIVDLRLPIPYRLNHSNISFILTTSLSNIKCQMISIEIRFHLLKVPFYKGLFLPRRYSHRFLL